MSRNRDKIKEVDMVVRGGLNHVVPLAPVLGPLGISPKRASEQISSATKEYHGIKVKIRLIIKNYKILEVKIIPTASALIYKAAGHGTDARFRERRMQNSVTNCIMFDSSSDISLKDIFDIAKELRPSSKAKTFKGTVLEVLGSCQSCGVTVEGEKPKHTQQKIVTGTVELPPYD